MWHDENAEEPTFTDTLELDLSTVVPSIAGPKRPQDRVALTDAAQRVRRGDQDLHAGPDQPARRAGDRGRGARRHRDPPLGRRSTMSNGSTCDLKDGAVVIAAITSCTNTSNPSVMIAAGPAGPQRRGQGPDGAPVGQDVAGARLAGRHRVPRARGPHRGPGGARLPQRRLRLHDVHRQLRSAARGDQRGDQRAGPRRRVGPLGQPQLRGPHQPRREDELPRVAAARRGVRDRRLDGRRPPERPARPGLRRAATSSSRTSGPRRPRSPDRRGVRAVGHVPQELRPGLRRRRRVERDSTSRRATASPGTPTRPTCGRRRTSTACPRRRRRSATSRAPGCWPSSATPSPPTTSRRPGRSRRTAPRAATSGARRRARATSTPTARGAATTR